MRNYTVIAKATTSAAWELFLRDRTNKVLDKVVEEISQSAKTTREIREECA